MTDVSEFGGSGADGAGAGGEPARQPPGRRRLRRLVPVAVAVLALVGVVAVWVPLHRSGPARPAQPVGPLVGSPGSSTGAVAMVDSPVADPAPLPGGPLPRGALIYARCGGMGAVGGQFPEDCRYRLVLTDGSQYTLPISAVTFAPGSISPDGAFLLVRDALESLVLRHLPTGTSRRVTIPSLEHWGGGWGPVVWSPGGRHAAVVIDHNHGLAEAVAVLDTASASVLRTVDLDAVPAAAGGDRNDAFPVAVDGGELSWARVAETSMTLVHRAADEQRPRVVDVDLRPHLRPGERLVDRWPGVMLGDGVTTAVPVSRAHDKAAEADLREVHAILLVDVTTGAVRHRQELPTTILAGELLSSGCGLGPDALVLARFDEPDPDLQPATMTGFTGFISLDPWTGARGKGYQFSPRGLFPNLAC